MSVDKDEPDVQRPDVLAALLVLDCLNGSAAEAVPMSAAFWIVEGYEGTELVKLAGLSGEDTYEVRDVLRATLDAMGIAPPSRAEACRIVFEHLASQCLAGRTSERTLVRDIGRIYIDSGYSDAVLDQPLGQIYGFDDERGAGWGRTGDELTAEVRSACREQMRSGGN